MKDLQTVLENTHKHLQFIETEIKKGVHDITPGYFESTIQNLSKDSNLLTQEIRKMQNKAIRVDQDLHYQLLATIDRIRHSQAFLSALGSAQGTLLSVLKKIESAIYKWTPKVEKTEQHPM